MRIGSLILAGGLSIRMGQPKESLPFRGGTLLGRLAAELQTCSQPVVVVARGGDQVLPPLPPGVLVTADERPDGGPLWGMRSGLRFLRQHGHLGAGDAVFVGACDAPFVRADFVGWLVAQLGPAQLVMPCVAGSQITVAPSASKISRIGTTVRLRILTGDTEVFNGCPLSCT